LKTFVALCPVKDLPANKPRLVKLGARRFAAVRVVVDGEEAIHVVDDRCPHEGHPLSMGLVRATAEEGCSAILTCPWHNWKFDLGTGDCLFGGESVARYATEIHHETVFIAPELDGAATRLRTERDLARATSEGQLDVALRESLRLVSLIGTPGDDGAARPFAVLAPIAAEHTPFGAADGILAIAAAKRLMEAGVLRAPTAYLLAISAVAEEARARGARPRPVPFSARLDQDRGPFLADLVEERRTDALARVLGLPAEERLGVTAAWLVPFASLKLWDRGLALPRVLAAATLAAGNDDKLGESLALGAASTLAWAVAESDLPGFRPTRVALQEVARRASPPEGLATIMDETSANTMVSELLASERRAVDALLTALESHTAEALVPVLLGAALRRAASYDGAWTAKVGSDVDPFEAGRLVLLAAAISELTPAPKNARFLPNQLVQLAGLTGRLSRISTTFESPVSAVWDRSAIRELALAAPAAWMARGRGLAVLDALDRLVAFDSRSESLAVAARDRLFCPDRAPALARVLANAEKFLADGLPPEGIV
jgi:nitrite reductase/ring-hydroxylating ferredoxin subunit